MTLAHEKRPYSFFLIWQREEITHEGSTEDEEQKERRIKLINDLETQLCSLNSQSVLIAAKRGMFYGHRSHCLLGLSGFAQGPSLACT